MNLLESMMSDCVMVNKSKVSDGEGGFKITWTEDANTIKVAITHDSSIDGRVAESNGVTSTYTLTTSRDVVLEYHDVIKRVSDGKYFRVTSDAGDTVSPNVSTLNISQVTAEKWELTK